MARIRSIKPELPHSESMGAVSREARLLFILLWTVSDDAGRLRGNSRMLASLLYPYDDDAKDLIDGWLAELESEECVRRYKIGKDSYLEICNWLNHQKIDKPTPSKLPAFCEDSPTPREDSRNLTVGKEGNGKEGNGKEVDHSGKPARKKPNTSRPASWRPNANHQATADQNGLSLDLEFEKFANYHDSKGNMFADWDAAFRTWLSNAKQFSKPGKVDVESQNQKVLDEYFKTQPAVLEGEFNHA